MANQSHDGNEVTAFSFQSVVQGEESEITILKNEGHYGVLIDGMLIAQVALNEDRHTWFVSAGKLTDEDLVKEIGERIEAKLY